MTECWYVEPTVWSSRRYPGVSISCQATGASARHDVSSSKSRVVSRMFKVGLSAMYLDCSAKGQEVRLYMVQNTTVSHEATRTGEYGFSFVIA